MCVFSYFKKEIYVLKKDKRKGKGGIFRLKNERKMTAVRRKMVYFS